MTLAFGPLPDIENSPFPSKPGLSLQFVVCIIATIVLASSEVLALDEDWLRSLKRRSIDGCISCHGSNSFVDARPDKLWQSTYQIWQSRDPHAGAFASLWNDRSRNIVGALDLQAVSSNEHYRRVLGERCISCHSAAPNRPSATLDSWAEHSTPDRLLSDGVSCHACHSANDSQNELSWIDLHTKQDWVDGKIDKRQSGLVGLDDLTTRAQRCAACHVGGPNRDVNHDLIAAGHPRLVFEFNSHLSRLPKHWFEDDRSSDFHVRCWSVGQTVLARSSLELLRSRLMEAGAGKKPWPEFAEYGCLDCHHPISAEWDPRGNLHRYSPGWGTWGFAFRGGEDWNRSVDQLRAEMQKPWPQPQSVADLAGRLLRAEHTIDAVRHLNTCLEQHPTDKTDSLFAWYLAANSRWEDLRANSQTNEGEVGSPTSVRQLASLLIELKKQIDAASDGGVRGPRAESDQLEIRIRELVLRR